MIKKHVWVLLCLAAATGVRKSSYLRRITHAPLRHVLWYSLNSGTWLPMRTNWHLVKIQAGSIWLNNYVIEYSGSHQLCVPLWLQQCIATNRIEADFMRFLCSHVSCSPFFCLWCSPSLIVKALLLPQVLLYVRYRLLVFIDKKVFPKWCFRGGKYLRTFSIVTRNVYIVRFYSEHRGLI